MSKLFSKARFYSALYAARLGFGARGFTEIDREPLRPDEPRPRKLRIHFWTPVQSPGANVIVHDMLPALREEVAAAGLDWRINVSEQLPDREVDWLVCFKAVPDRADVVGRPRKVFLICDMKHYFWSGLREFDSVVVAPARSMAAMIALGHPRVAFLGESEPLDYLAFGEENLRTPPAERGDVLMWHGGKWSLPPLLELRPELEKLAASRQVELHVVSGQNPAREETWGNLRVKFLPWSKEQLRQSAARARLGLTPAKASLRLSWLKPASRVRCLYSLGIPTIGDARAPDVADFLTQFQGPCAAGSRSWSETLARLWDDPEELRRLAAEGHAVVRDRHSTRQTARQWARFFSTNQR